MPWTQPWSPGQWRSWRGREREGEGWGRAKRPREGWSQVCWVGAPLPCPFRHESLSSPQPFTVYVSPSNLVPRVCPQLSIYPKVTNHKLLSSLGVIGTP